MKNQRRARKGLITTKIAAIQRLVSEGGSRTKIQFLQDKLIGLLGEVTSIAEEIHRRTNDYADEEWINTERERVDECTAEVSEYLEARKDDDPSSKESFTKSWLKKHAKEATAEVSSEFDEYW